MQTVVTNLPAARSWPKPLPAMVKLCRAVLIGFRRWRERRLLIGLSDHVLRDLALTRADVEREYQQPVWRPIDYLALEDARRRTGPRLGHSRYY